MRYTDTLIRDDTAVSVKSLHALRSHQIFSVLGTGVGTKGAKKRSKIAGTGFLKGTSREITSRRMYGVPGAIWTASVS